MKKLTLTASVLLDLYGVAQARPRDEVMINAYRCAGQSSSRTWLDCYYGAAQPQRAILGLSPAPPAQIVLVTAPPQPGTPQDVLTRDAVIGAAARCGSVAAERPWLDCYYAAANPMRSLLGLSPLPGFVPPPALSHKDNGFMRDVLPKPELQASGRVASYRFDGNGFFTVTLANGEVWRQLDGDTTYAHWFKKPESYFVTITGGALGSLNLRLKGDPHSYKVKRVS
jgi:hypothetical protein